MMGGERQQWYSSDQIAKFGMLAWVFFPNHFSYPDKERIPIPGCGLRLILGLV